MVLVAKFAQNAMYLFCSAWLICTPVVAGMKSYTVLTREQVLFIDMNDKFRYGYQNFIAFNSELTANNL